MVYLTDAAIPSREANSIQSMKMCEAFAQQGLDVTLIVPDRPSEENGDPYKFYDVEECFDIIFVRWTPGERYLYSLLVPRHVRRVDPDIVYGRFVPACFFTSLLGYRVVVESHSPVSDSGRIIAWMFRTLLRLGRLDHLVVISEALNDYYLKEYEQLLTEDVTVAHDAASELPVVEMFSFAESERLQVGYVGHLYEGKGMSLIAELVNKCPWADFHIVGGKKDDIAYWESELDEHDNIEFYGFVPPREVYRYQQSVDVLLAPYQHEVYGSSGKTDISRWMSPLKVFEYMATGNPIVYSNISSLNEILVDVDAIPCNPNKPRQWIDALLRINNNVSDETNTKTGNKEYFLNNHTYIKRAEKIISALSS